jgi:Family of unknown function (DUF5706)
MQGATVDDRSAVQYLVRNTQQQYVQLSAQADLKANIIITASSLLLTISATRLDNPDLRGTIGVLAVGCLSAMVMAILAVLPTSKSTASNNDADLLFHVDVAALGLHEYEDRMREVCESDQMILDTQLHNLHSFATFLVGTKYRRLRWAYIAFLFGVVAATLNQVVQEIALQN